MEAVIRIASTMSKWMTSIAKVVLTFMILLTVADVILRSFRRPIVGTYELVGFAGAVVMGFSIPFTSWVKGHIFVDLLILKLPQKVTKIVDVLTRCLGMGLFLILGWNLIGLGAVLHKAGEVSSTLEIPFYPLVYGLGICCFIECLVLLCDILKAFGGKYE
jgi:TRAP-type C4-dicarboxylate transport system permease small subunit